MNKEKTIDEYIKDVWGNDVKKFIINSHAEAYIHRLERENQQLKKQKDDVVEYIKNKREQLHHSFDEPDWDYLFICNPDDLLRMLGEIDVKD